MKLKIWQEGLKKIIDHIIQLKQDGDFLAEKGSYNHAYFSYYTALEELTKAYFILDRFNNPAPKEFKLFLSSHWQKAQLFASRIFEPEIDDIPDLIEILKEIKSKIPKFGSIKDFKSKSMKLGKKIEKRKKLQFWRFRSLYVDIDKDDQNFLTPDEIPMESVKELKEKLEIELGELQATRDTYFHFKTEPIPMKEFKNDLETQKTIDESVKLLELLKLTLSGSKEELKNLEGVPTEYKEIFLTILEDDDFDESLIDRVASRTSNILEKFQNLDEPVSESEKDRNSFYFEKLHEYLPDHNNKIGQEFIYYIKNYCRKFFRRIGAMDELTHGELDGFIDFGLQYFINLLNIKTEDNELMNKFESQLEKTPNNIELLSNLGELYLKMGYYKNAFGCFKKIYNLDKKNANAIYYLAEINLRVRGKIKKAISFYKEIEAHYEDDSTFWLFIGNLYEYKKKYKKALEYYWKAIYIQFESDDAWYRIGSIYNIKGETEQAKLLVNIALKINPFHDEAKELLDQLDYISDLKRNDIWFRETSNNDLDYLFELKNLTLKEYIEKTWKWDDNWQRDYLVSNFNPKKTRVITKSEEDIGCIVVKKKRKDIIIKLFLITPENQNQGIGSLILKFIINEAKKQNKRVSIDVLKANNRALNLYESNGFKIVGEDNARYHLLYFSNKNDNEN